MGQMKYFLYILYSKRIDKYYIGRSENPQQRLISHNNYPKGWTKRGIPWRLVFTKEFPDKKSADFWERFIKVQKSKQLIEKIINNEFEWKI